MSPKIFSGTLGVPSVLTRVVIGVVALGLLGALGILAAPKHITPKTKDSGGSTVSTNDCKAGFSLPEWPEIKELEKKYSSYSPSLTNLHEDPDATKVLLGYDGPYYNNQSVKGGINILPSTLYTWHGDSWKVTGMIRNETCKTTRITLLRARLLGLKGETLETVSAQVPLDELRPGEPAPFIAESLDVSQETVAKVVWEIETTPSSGLFRDFKIRIDEAETIHGGATYSLFGLIENSSRSSAGRAHVLAAWINTKGEVVFVASPMIRLIKDPNQLKPDASIAPGDQEDFIYQSDDPGLKKILSQSRVAVWGISQ